MSKLFFSRKNSAKCNSLHYTCTSSFNLLFLVLAVLLNHINLPEVTIAFDGSLYERHPKYSFHIADLLAKLVPTTQVRTDTRLRHIQTFVFSLQQWHKPFCKHVLVDLFLEIERNSLNSG